MDMFGMLGKLKELQAKVQEAQASLQHITATGESGAGLVRATANGQHKLVKLEIDESLMVKEDREVLADLVVAAVNKAIDEASEKAAAEMKSKTAGLMPNIPGLDLGNLNL
jgi:DNA-binding YbaB/EbfC family protein